MLRSRLLVSTAAMAVASVRCDGRESAWSAPELVSQFSLVLVRSGLFRRQVDGSEIVVDACSGYLERAGSEHRIAHPAGGDICTTFTINSAVLDATTRGAVLPQNRLDAPIFTSPAVDVAHRALLAQASAGVDAEELEEQALLVVGSV